MKMIYAGTEEALTPYANLLFNCNRNKNCEREFYIPIKVFSDLVLYADFVGEPETIGIEIIDVCDPETSYSAVSGLYVAGTKPDGSWYGVFGSLTVAPNTLKRFFVKISVLIDGVTYVYYSQQIEFPVCDPLTFVRSCYPLEEVGVDAVDCNGVYYGQPNNPDDALGNISYRYIHSAFVRMASVIEQKNKLTFTAFNNKKTYKSNFVREWLFESEIVPTFYKDELIGIFNRGNIEIDGTKWKLAESQDISMIDIDSKLWRLDITLDDLCKQTFGCAPDDCTFPPPPCNLDDEVSGEVADIEGVQTLTISVPVGTASGIQYEVYERDTLVLIASGSGLVPDTIIVPLAGIDPETTCYFWRYRMICDGNFSAWSTRQLFGDCDGGGGGPTYYSYHCERYLCSDCAIPLDEIIAQSTNPALTLFKYYKSLSSPGVTLRPTATSLAIAADTIVGIARDTCLLSCSDPPPPPPDDF